MPSPITQPVPLAQVELATGLSREVLRKWELRFQFPMPHRGARGQRLYQEKDVEKLQLIQLLLSRGLRPRNLVPLSMPALESLLAASTQQHPRCEANAEVQALLASMGPGSAPHAVQKHLEAAICEVGLARFVHDYIPVFNEAVGAAWVAGQLGVHCEHRYTDALQSVVRAALAGHYPDREGCRVLLTTPPGEPHSLGLLAVKAALTLQGAECISLGTQTPVQDVVHAVQEWNVAVVGVSMSSFLAPEAGLSYALTLRRALPPQCKLWVGGDGAKGVQLKKPAGMEFFFSTSQVLQTWEKLKPRGQS